MAGVTGAAGAVAVWRKWWRRAWRGQRLWSVMTGVGLAVWVAGCSGAWIGGIHAVLRYRGATHTVIVEEVPANGAAARAGLRVGDEVTHIEDARVADLTAEDVRNRLRGEVGSRVHVRIRRGDEDRDIEIERAPYR